MDTTNKRVLILDDDAAVRESLADYLEDRGWQVETAASAEDALEIIRQKHISGAVVDIRLPGASGDVFIHEARQLRPDLVFVIYTGSPEYRLPGDLTHDHTPPASVFVKPLDDMGVLEEELIRLMNPGQPE